MALKSLTIFFLLLSGIPTFSESGYTCFKNQTIYIEEIERDDGEISIDFAVSINPASVTHENIYINNNPLPKGVRIHFNRRGDEMKIRELRAWRNELIYLELRKVLSATGEDISPHVVFRLFPDDEVEFDEPDWFD